MTEPHNAPRRRGRPPKQPDGQLETRLALIRRGMEVLTERGFTATGLEGFLKQVGVPKGSFYHYFDSKEAFGRAVMDSYARYFERKLDRHLLNTQLSPLQRLDEFVADASAGMARHGFRRGCLVGNMGQEVAVLPDDFRQQLDAILHSWQQRLTVCLQAAQAQGELSAALDAEELAQFFWIGWEGAVLRARLQCSATPLDVFYSGFLRMISASRS
ncbi:TetR/AcrR family transcriptional regulator [Pokkaliibacter plantistimulans]|nr:TetR/AcrR family transcriptional regulator [Pokkaliibacter plantistimulans]